MVTEFTVGPYQMELLPVHNGPALNSDAGTDTEALASVINHATTANGAEIAAAIAERRLAFNGVVSVAPPRNEDSARNAVAIWAALSGDPPVPPEDLAIVGIVTRPDTLVVPWNLLKDAVAQLKQLQETWQPPPGPALFRAPARSVFLSPEDRPVVDRLAAESRAIDELDLDAEVGHEPQSLIERRRVFLYECRAAGLFDADHATARARWLGTWNAPVLQSLLDAAQTLRSWGFVEPDRAPPECSVCLDFVRHSLWPPGEDGYEWACAGLSLLTDPVSGEQGVVMDRSGGVTLQVWWRRDGDRPALLAVSVGARRG